MLACVPKVLMLIESQTTSTGSSFLVFLQIIANRHERQIRESHFQLSARRPLTSGCTSTLGFLCKWIVWFFVQSARLRWLQRVKVWRSSKSSGFCSEMFGFCLASARWREGAVLACWFSFSLYIVSSKLLRPTPPTEVPTMMPKFMLKVLALLMSEKIRTRYNRGCPVLDSGVIYPDTWRVFVRARFPRNGDLGG